MHLFAVEHIRAMRGGSLAHLMRCSNDEYYVVKFQNNPHGTRTLANELLGTLLAKSLDLPVAEPTVVEVSEVIINLSKEMGGKPWLTVNPCQPGLCFGSRLVSVQAGEQNIGNQPTFDFLPTDCLRGVTNLSDFIGMLVFDVWTGNVDSRQAVFVRLPEEEAWTAIMIDQGQCFAGKNWDFRRSPSEGLYFSSVVYESVTGISDFEPWLRRLENEIDLTVLEHVAGEIPPSWYEQDAEALSRLLTVLNERRVVVRKLLWETCESSRREFPNWIGRQSDVRTAATHR